SLTPPPAPLISLPLSLRSPPAALPQRTKLHLGAAENRNQRRGTALWSARAVRPGACRPRCVRPFTGSAHARCPAQHGPK
ncbi:hypothetical protein JOQ06_011283, partial [Pogonophryne albipinna]